MSLFPPKNWVNLPGETTPVSAEGLIDLENRLAAWAEGGALGNVGFPAILRKGVFASTDWSFKATVNSVNGQLGSEAATGGTCWVNGEYATVEEEEAEGPIPLIRTLTEQGVLKNLVPPKLPTAAKPYMWASFILSAPSTAVFGQPANVSIRSGTQTTAEGTAKPAPTTDTTPLKILDVLMKYEAGTYVILKEMDRRPWARGGFARIERTSGNITVPASVAPLDATGLAIRMECQKNAQVRLTLRGEVSGFTGTEYLSLGFRGNGATISGSVDGQGVRISGNNFSAINFEYVYAVPSAGSYLFQPTGFKSAGTLTIPSEAAHPLRFVVQEIARENANNGTT